MKWIKLKINEWAERFCIEQIKAKHSGKQKYPKWVFNVVFSIASKLEFYTRSARKS